MVLKKLVLNIMLLISLTYLPKDATLKRKFGNLPLQYVRMRIDSDSELMLFEKAMRMFKFNLNESDDDSDDLEKMITGGENSEFQILGEAVSKNKKRKASKKT